MEQRFDDVWLTVDCDNGKTIHLKQSEYADEHGRLHLVNAYASTIYAAQGRTIRGDSFVLYDHSMGQKDSYVAGSRHKQNCHWYANAAEMDILSHQTIPTQESRIEALAQSMNQQLEQQLASEYLNHENQLEL
jgi:hypothetical protein